MQIIRIALALLTPTSHADAEALHRLARPRDQLARVKVHRRRRVEGTVRVVVETLESAPKKLLGLGATDARQRMRGVTVVTVTVA